MMLSTESPDQAPAIMQVGGDYERRPLAHVVVDP
jgi:hypothetical protein